MSNDTRHYHTGCESEIAAEVLSVLSGGTSTGWCARREEDGTWVAARYAERQLSKYNIGYIDDMFGKWGYRMGGTSFFQEVVCRATGCNEPADNGEGWNGYCGNCADKLETEESS